MASPPPAMSLHAIIGFMADDSGSYEVRHGSTRKLLPLLVACLVFFAVGLLPDIPIVARIIALLLGGGGGWVSLHALIRRGLALRVDQAGVTFGATPGAIRSNEFFVPWSDIEEIVLWSEQAGPNEIRFIGLKRHDGLPPLPGIPKGRVGEALRRMSGIPEELAWTSRPVNTWRLDRQRLRETVARFAPAVEIVDFW